MLSASARSIPAASWMGFSATILRLFFCALGGYGFAKFKFPGQGALFAFLLGTMIWRGAGGLTLGFLQASDSTDPAMAGVWGALKGSFLTIVVTMALAFPVGVLSAIGISKLIMLIFPSLPASVPAWAVISGLSVSIFVGLVFGVWPARKAARLDPIEALRYE